MSAANGDLLDQGRHLLSPIDIPPVKRVAMELNIFDAARDLADQRHLTMVLGLDVPPKEPRTGPDGRAFPMLAVMPARATSGKRRKS